MASLVRPVRGVAVALVLFLVAGAVQATTVATPTATESGAGSTVAWLDAAWSAGRAEQAHGRAAPVAVPTIAALGSTAPHLVASVPGPIDGRPNHASVAGRGPVTAVATVAPARSTHTATISVAPRTATTRTTATVTLGSFGRLSIPGIGLSGSVDRWGCRGGTLPNRIEQWGCAGSGNTYLMGHAFGVFHPLLTAYSAGRLRAGLLATVTTRSGSRTYRLAWARIVPATYDYRGLSGDLWAWNATSSPSLTLQTCWGAGSRYRLIVRFVAVG